MRASLLIAQVIALVIAPAAWGGASPAWAEPTGQITGTVTVTESDGKPANPTDVIVYVVGFTEPASDRVSKIEQKDRKFVPDLVAITANESVLFPNKDPFLHNVFSQSKPRKFDLGSFTASETPKGLVFPEAGVVDVYCNIHPEMAATILVLPNRRHTRVSASGRYVIEGVPPGTWAVFAYTRRATKPESSPVTVQAGASSTVDFKIVRGAEPAHLNKYGERYHDAGQVYR